MKTANGDANGFDLANNSANELISYLWENYIEYDRL
jgi:hypothetical protein